MTNQASLFLRNLTAIDHAYIDNEGKVKGGSLHLSVDVTGEVDPVENVVVDFSTIKKDIKGIVDGKENGFDHKLWIIPSSNAEVKYNRGNLATDAYYQITTPACFLLVPANAVKVITEPSVGDQIQKELDEELNAKYPGINISTNVKLTSNIFSNSELSVLFNYVHGLKNSTSWGCQNLAHGHTSWMEFTDKEGFSTLDHFLITEIKEINNAVFIWKDNIVENRETAITIQYETERGRWQASYLKDMNNIIVMDEETTIENITKWFVERNRENLEYLGVARVFISEGLQKGSFVDL